MAYDYEAISRRFEGVIRRTGASADRHNVTVKLHIGTLTVEKGDGEVVLEADISELEEIKEALED